MEFTIVPKTLTVKRIGEPISDEYATEVSIDDEAGGLFIKLNQYKDDGSAELRFDVDEWPMIARAVRMAIRTIKKIEEEKQND